MIPMILDIIVVVLLALFLLRGGRMGFISSVISFLGGIVSAIFAAFLGNQIAPLIFRSYIENPLVDGLVNAFTTSGSDSLSQDITQNLEGFPSFIQIFVNDNFTTFIQDMESGVNETVVSGANSFVDQTLGPIIISLIALIIFFILMGIFGIIIRLLSKGLRGVNQIPVVGSVNSLLGAAVGLAQGVLALFLLLALVSLFIGLTGNINPWVNSTIIEQSFVCKFFYFRNPFVNEALLGEFL